MGLINIVSNLPLPVRLFEPHPDPDKPGNSPELRSVVLPGKSHPDSRPMVTRGVDSEVFDAWKAANPNHQWLKGEHIRVISDEDANALDEGPLQFGWEPGLEGAEGSGAGPDADLHHTEVDMTAYSDVPNDDSPRSQTTGFVSGGVVASPPPMDPEGPAFDTRNAKRAAPLRGGEVQHGDSPLEPVKEPGAGQEEPKDESTLRGKSREEVEGK